MRLTFLLLLLCTPIVVGTEIPIPPRVAASPFRHIVVIVQENRTPDNLFQGLCAPPYGSPDACSASGGDSKYDIQTNAWLDERSPTGTTEPTPIPLANGYDLDHSNAAFTAMCDADPFTGFCLMDGAGAVTCLGNCVKHPQFRYVENTAGRVTPYLELATQYGWANYMFQTNRGPSFPAHQFLFGGTSAPSAADDSIGVFASENVSPGGPAGIAGCFAPADTTVQLIGPDGYELPGAKVYPCFEHETLPDVLPGSVTWRYYTPSSGSIWTAPNAIQHICESSGPGGECQGKEWARNVDLKPADILRDIGSCNLRSVSWVVPSGANSDHPRVTDGRGPAWVAAIVNAIGMSSKCDSGRGYWRDTAILITWDDWGGWYDHEPPPTLDYPQGGYQYGFRVPLLVVSAYTPRHTINNAKHDFGSILRFIESNFGVEEGALHFADARANNDLLGFFDFQLKARPYTAIAAPTTAEFFLNDPRPPSDPDDQ
ncbi:MAG: hypothetical protein JO319_20405 [Acidobacteriaceae bacterium]|nr:hypothetical protein [Acidobacteriaceae bacterium]